MVRHMFTRGLKSLTQNGLRAEQYMGMLRLGSPKRPARVAAGRVL